jgi:hypothetical protein
MPNSTGHPSHNHQMKLAILQADEDLAYKVSGDQIPAKEAYMLTVDGVPYISLIVNPNLGSPQSLTMALLYAYALEALGLREPGDDD